MSTGAPVTARIDALTGVRAFSALGVFLYHAGVFPWGYTGVDLFFALSGFVLTLNYASSFPSLTADRYRSFLQARLARIWPLHAVTFLLALPYYFAAGRELSWLLPGKALANLLLVHTAVPRGVWLFNQVSWSLSNELFFYTAFPLVCAWLLPRLSSPRRLIFLLGGSALLIGLTVAAVRWSFPFPVSEGSANYLLYYFPAFRFLEFLIGCFAGKLYLLQGRRPAPAAPLWMAFSALLAFLGMGLVHAVSARPLLLTTLYGLPFGLFLYFLARSAPSRLTRFLGGKVMVVLGNWSFAFYMLHWLVLRYYELAGFPTALAVKVPVTLLASVLLSGLSYRWVEMPGRKRIMPGRWAAHESNVAAARDGAVS